MLYVVRHLDTQDTRNTNNIWVTTWYLHTQETSTLKKLEGHLIKHLRGTLMVFGHLKTVEALEELGHLCT